MLYRSSGRGGSDDVQLALVGNSTRGGKAGDPDSFTIEGAAGHIDREGLAWGVGASISYSFRSTAPSEMPDDTGGFSRFNVAQINATLLALQAWSDVANINFTRVGSGTGSSAYSNSATILFANYSSGADGAAAFAYLPGSTASSSVAGDAWFNSTLAYNTNPVLNGYGRHTLLHEIGHTIGLSHPGEYNAGEGDPSYADADYREDTRQYSVMSYWSETNTAASFGGAYASGPLLDDIAAAQLMYGPNMATRATDTTYGFNSTAGRDFYAATSATTKLVFAVWDGGGFDTLDFSGYTQAQTIDLRPGEFSSVGGLTYNVSIAQGAFIERAIGGSGVDTMTASAYGAPTAVADLTKGQATDLSSRTKALSLEGKFGLQLDANIVSSTAIPHATVNATAKGGGQEYYAVTVTAGQQLTIDIDSAASFDSYVTLYNASGTRLDGNDDGPKDAGSTRLQDSYLTYNVTAAGTYYVAVGSFVTGSSTGGNLTAGATYTLNVSVTGEPVPVGALVGSTLEGRAGNDILTGSAGADILNGGAGADRMTGGLGNDTYYVDNTGDVVTEASSAGTDTVVSALAYTLGSNVENLTLSGAENLAGTGNSLANVIKGNSGQNKITGGAGADILTGGGRTDTLIYKALSDSTVAAPDRITDLSDPVDQIDFRAIDGNTAVSGVQGFEIVDAFTRHAGELVLDYNAGTNTTSLMVDVNGDGKADMLILLTGDHEAFDRFLFGGG